jgi:hypothetical protein
VHILILKNEKRKNRNSKPRKAQFLRKLVERAIEINPHGFLAC